MTIDMDADACPVIRIAESIPPAALKASHPAPIKCFTPPRWPPEASMGRRHLMGGGS